MGGTLGGIFRQDAGDDGWEHLTNGLPDGAEVHAITVHPGKPRHDLCRQHQGHLSQHQSRRHVGAARACPSDADIWSVCVHPKNPQRHLCRRHARPASIAATTAATHWRKMADPGLPDRVIMAFACRVMRLDVDPNSPDDVYATIEANGAMRSRNAGESWEDCTADLIRFCEEPKYRSRIGSQTEIEGMLDGHALACSAAAPGTVFLANRMGLFRSNDRGETLGGHGDRPVLAADLWPRHPHLAARPEGACTRRSARRRAAPTARSTSSDDVGKTWKRFDHGIKADATMMGVDGASAATRTRSTASRASARCSGPRTAARAGARHRLPEGVRDVYAVACG